MEQKRVLIVEDQPLFPQLLQTAVSSVPDMEVVGIAENEVNSVEAPNHI